MRCNITLLLVFHVNVRDRARFSEIFFLSEMKIAFVARFFGALMMCCMAVLRMHLSLSLTAAKKGFLQVQNSSYFEEQEG